MKQFLSSKHLMVGLLFLFALSTGCRDKKVVTDSFFQPYSKTSAIYTLSLFSTVNDGMTGNLASLQAHLDTSVAAILQNDTIVSLVGKWEAVWGPVSYTNDTNSTPNARVSDNVMVLLKGLDPADPTKSMYVIAIAGTNPISTFDWMEEDFNADSLVQWPATSNLPNISAFNNPVIATDPAITNAGNYVSEGTATGLNILLNVMKDVSGNTLFQYLKDSVGNSNASLELATTGHSLAGALAPCMALVLKNNQPYWNPSGSISISSYATAGPSPGNSGFAQYFQSQMGSNFFGAYNSLDVIPHGFQYSMMEQVGGLYDSLINPVSNSTPNCVVGSLANCVADNVQAFNYTSIFAPTMFFTASVGINQDSLQKIYNLGLSTWPTLSDKEQAAFVFEADDPCDLSVLDNHAPYYAVAYCFATLTAAEHGQAYVNFYGARVAYDIVSRYLISSPFDQTSFVENLIENTPILWNCVD